MMDDFSITDERLTLALNQLRWVNLLLGGYSATMSVLAPFLYSRKHRITRILDLGTGVADYPEFLVRWADRRDIDIEVVAVDANPATVAYANQELDLRLPYDLRRCIQVEVADVQHLPYSAGAFDVVLASMFLHHFRQDEAVATIKEMDRIGGGRLLINDLHRHPIAFYSFVALSALLPASSMFKHDGRVSVLRGFTRQELQQMAGEAGLAACEIKWRWAFRWTLSTLSVER